MSDFVGILKRVDPDVAEVLGLEEKRQREGLELIASENFVSPSVLAAVGSVLTNKYAEGYPGKRYYGGCHEVDKVEIFAQERALALFGLDHANVQPHSGSQANMAVYESYLKPGETVLALSLAHGGHLTHGHSVNFSGMHYRFVHYGLDPETETIDYDAMLELAKKERPRLIVAGASAYPRRLDFHAFSRAAKEVGAALMVDMAHIAGLVAAGEHPNPCEVADFVTTTTHKTLRGPRGGMVLCKKEFKKDLDKITFPGIQGGPLMHVIAGKAVCLKEAATPEFKEYQKQVRKNVAVLTAELVKGGLRAISGGTDTHLGLFDVTPLGMTGKDAEQVLDKARITVNKNAIPFDKEKPFVTSGIRIGAPALTSRGMKEAEMLTVATFITRALTHAKDDVALAKVGDDVREFARKFPLRAGPDGF